MSKKRITVFSMALAILILLLSGCARGPQSETIVIPNSEVDYTASQSNQPFQLKTIYRLPISAANNGQVLGWSGQNVIIGLFNDSRPSVQLTQKLQRLSPPYDKVDMLQELDIRTTYFGLSPDGRYISWVTQSKDGFSLKLSSLSDGGEQIVATIYSSHQQLLSRKLTWSNNNRYASYLLNDSVGGQARIGIYDTVDRITSLYPVVGLKMKSSISTVKMSDDGTSALIVMLQPTGSSIAMVTMNGSEFALQYEHPAGDEQITWLNNDQFVFLGAEGTLYEYDCRNGVLSVLLEKIGIFQISQDQKYIAYSQNEKDAIYAGKLQGNNVLYAKSIYQGIVPLQMLWSSDNDALLIDGRKLYERAQPNTDVVPAPVVATTDSLRKQQLVEQLLPDNQPFIIKFQ